MAAEARIGKLYHPFVRDLIEEPSNAGLTQIVDPSLYDGSSEVVQAHVLVALRTHSCCLRTPSRRSVLELTAIFSAFFGETTCLKGDGRLAIR